MMTTESHDEKRIHRAVMEAVEALEGPDRARLSRIERRLLERARRGRAPGWRWGVLLIGLVAGSAIAYWAGSGGWWFGDEQTVEDVPAVSEPTPVGEDAGSVPEPATEPTGADDSSSSEEVEDGDPELAAGQEPDDARDDDNDPVIYIAP